ncbi:hypothetical protein [Myroides sp. DW712]|uniref:hypothetical protein n=1 Tax=Myroides sp. DW712 TaxID=3389800 RepID=UPI00397A3DD9
MIQRPLFFSVLLLVLLLISCSNYIGNEDQYTSPKRWKATFQLQDRKVPIIFELDTVPLNIHGYRVIFIDGPSKNQKEIVKIMGDSLRVALDYFGKFQLKAIMQDHKIQGVFQSQKSMPPLEIPFTAYATNEPRFTPVAKPTYNNATGDWEFTFQADAASPNLDLYQKLHRLKLYQTDSTLVGRGYYNQGFEGIRTENGFVLSSFSQDQPVFFEATFFNGHEVSGTLYTYQEKISFQGRKKSNLESTKEESSTIMTTLWRLFKVYSDYPK